MDLTDIFSDPVKKTVLGIVLIFLGLVVVPHYTGVGPLSVTSQYYVLSASFDRATRTFFGEVLLFSTPDSGSSETLTFQLNPSDAEEDKIHADPFYLSAKIVDQYVLMPYSRIGYVDDFDCVHFEKSVSVGSVYTGSDDARALQSALADISDKISGMTDRVIILTRLEHTGGFLFLGGSVDVEGYVCGRYPDAAAYLEHQPGDQVFARISLSIRNSRGVVAGPIEITSTLGSGTSFKLVEGGREIGTVVFTGVERGTSFDELFSNAPVALLAPYKTSEGSYSVFRADHALSYYDSKAEALLAQLKNADVEFLSSPAGTSVQVSEYKSLSDAVSSYGKLVVAPNVIPYVVPTVDVQEIVSDVSSYHQTFLSDLSDPVTGYVVETNETPPSWLVLKRAVTDTSAYAYRIRYVLDANFVGIRPAVPKPDITSVDVGTCSDIGCKITVHLRNRSNDAGMITVGAYSSIFARSERSVYLSPLGTLDVSLFLQPSKKITSEQNDTLRVYARATHWLGDYTDEYTATVLVKPAKTCFLTNPVCTFDANKGLWAVLQCKSPYDPKPSLSYCDKGDACVNGQCVKDFVTGVECIGTKEYVVHYQYSGDKVMSCGEGYVCSKDYASQSKVPPCKRSGGFGGGGGGSFESRPIRIVFEHPDYRALARALVLIGVGVILL